MPKFKKSGFTLIELLVVIAIIGVLSTMAIIALGNARTKARDAKRVADIKQISTALELYYSDNNSYPTIITPGNSLTSPDGTKTYMSKIPTNPTPRNDGSCSNIDYSYSFITATNTYSVSACLGSGSSNINSGLASYSPNGLFNCGQSVTDLDGYSYPTVQAGGQCWMALGLRTKSKPDGTCINAGQSPPCPDASVADNNLGRACRNNTESICTTEGALYTWPAIMNGSVAAGAQGICPAGWHVPSDGDWGILESYFTDNGQACDVVRMGTWECSSAGTKLKVGGNSSLNFILNGVRSTDGVSFGENSQSHYAWTSSRSWVGGPIIFRRIYFSSDVILRYHDSFVPIYSLSLRCIKN
ncbi:MAG: prepilin-type N-terminal cleavage/methylation domain-containing protein [Candidatus Falkowbacteria bacterium]|nr:prepilin-type N-terminal cleavage/methylation domain-containing protein [Candidatus Falkowbacteria bacterium]